MNPNFLLSDAYAGHLYREYARVLPIVDFHNHLSAAELASDKSFDNITKLWISADPYKHRAMRILGIPERYITGAADDFEKFEQWYHCLPRLVGNVLFDWSVMEFAQILEMPLLPFRTDVKALWEELNEKLSSLSAQRILARFPIVYNAPCASLADTLDAFDPAAGLCPSLRGDDITAPVPDFIQALSALTGQAILSLDTYEHAIAVRLQDFLNAGCCFSDHALDDGFRYLPEDGQNDHRFLCLLQGKSLEKADQNALTSRLLRTMSGLYAQYQLTMQLHIGARRSTSTRLRRIAGSAGGYAAMGNSVDLSSLVAMLDDIEQQPYGLPKTLLFTLNPADNAMLSTLSGSFSKDGMEALVSQGPAWWWCDHYQGIRDMLDHMAAFGVLSTFVGMTTDSRSLLSFVRHDYFRRVLCSWISERRTKGLLPDDEAILSSLIRGICYENAAKLTKRQA